MKRNLPGRDELFQSAYDYGVDGACLRHHIGEDKFWDILYPPVLRIEFPKYAKKDVPYNAELSDIISTSYPYLEKSLITHSRDDISQLDSLQDAVIVTMQRYADVVCPDPEDVRNSIAEVFRGLEYYRKLNRSFCQEIREDYDYDR